MRPADAFSETRCITWRVCPGVGHYYPGHQCSVMRSKPMRFLAASIVVLAGCLLWGAGACAAAWTYEVKGNLWLANTAAYGGMVVVAFGSLCLLAAYLNRGERAIQVG